MTVKFFEKFVYFLLIPKTFNMKINIRILQVIILYSTCFYSYLNCNNGNIYFSNEDTAFSFLNGQEISLFIDNHKIGFLSYVKIPITKWYVIYSFFIKREYRNRGLGKKLFEKVLNEIHSKDVDKIFIQPGPFELIDGNLVTIDDSEKIERITKIVNFYTSYKFHLANNKFLSVFLNLLYKILGIDENSNFFMIYENREKVFK